jgi:hypothetical protein
MDFHLFSVFFSRTTRTTLAESRCPELLAQYCDILLRKGTSTHKKYSSEEIEAKIKDVVRRTVCSFFIKFLFTFFVL